MEAVLEWVVLVMRAVGSPGVGLATLLETVFPPVPSELVLPLAGYTASQGHYAVAAAIAWATVGSLLGALLLYWLGAAWGSSASARSPTGSPSCTPTTYGSPSRGSAGTDAPQCSSAASCPVCAA